MAMNPRLLRPTSSFSPKSISGLALWLDGSDASSLYTTDAGPVDAVSSPLDISGCQLWLDASDETTISDTAGAVDQWDDKSGNDRHFTATSTARPTTGSVTQGGRNVLDFDGSDCMFGNAASLDILRNVPGGTIILVAKTDSTAATQTLVSITRNGSNSQARMLVGIDSAAGGAWRTGGRRLDADSFAGIALNGSANTNPSVISAILDYANSDGGIFRDGTTLASSTSFQTDGNTSDTDSDYVQIGASTAGATEFYDGYIAEIIVYDTALTTSQRASVERYLAAKWGISNVHAPATSGAPVGYWRDKSGNNRHATQATAASRPVVGSVSGRPAIDLDGSDDYLANAAAPSGWEFGTIFCVHQRDGGTNQNVYGITTLSGNTMYCSVNNASGEYRSGGGLAGTGGVRSTGVVVNATPRLLTQIADNSSVYDLRLDAATASGTNGGFGNTVAGTYIGCRNSASLGLGLFFDGKVGEFLVYNRALTASERRRVESYLARRWGITLAPQVSNVEAQDWVDRVYANGGTVSTSTANAVSAFCDAIEGAGIRDRFYRLNLFAGTLGSSIASSGVVVPLYRGPVFGGTTYGNATDTPNVFAVEDYAETGASGGLTGNGSTKYLNTGLNADIFDANSFSLSVYQFGEGATAGSPARIGVRSGINVNQSMLYYRDGATRAIDDVTISYVPLPDGASEAGLIGLSRTASNDTRQFNQGSVGAVGNRGGVVRPAIPVFIFCTNSNGTPTFFTDERIAAYHIGAGLSSANIASYSAAMDAFQTALGRNV